ncbi:MAG TPA: cob(I)yrinic acid a,c-diamide adenosyltransferase [Gammaproteobacteria bacterium]|nr:cob(I)yrinic acid a,c-diamide adenosyltransferase [Gammaproteobacteria bacterium]
MGHRLSKIYTRTGDDGSTGLGDGSRTEKDSLRVEAFGDIDELNSYLGLLLSQEIPDEARTLLTGIQHDLFDLGGEVCIPGREALDEAYVSHLEERLDTLNANLSPLKEFILPGGVPSAATCHVARTVCRRAERRLVSLARREAVSATSLQYLNRLSDLLFVLARYLNQKAGRPDILWQPGCRQTD